MEVVPGIHKVDGVWGGNVYLIVEEDGLVLVDAGLPGSAGKILRYIEGLGRKPAELTRVILTHAHPDHTGTIPALRRRADARVVVHPQDTRTDKTGHPMLFYHGQLVAVSWELPLFKKIFAHELVEEGFALPVMGGLKVLHTPGHTPGSIALYLEDRRVLFTGDMLISDGRRFSRPVPFPGTNLKSYRRSIERLAQLEFEVACVGHGKPIVGGATEKVKEMLNNYFLAGPWWKLVRMVVPYR